MRAQGLPFYVTTIVSFFFLARAKYAGSSLVTSATVANRIVTPPGAKYGSRPHLLPATPPVAYGSSVHHSSLAADSFRVLQWLNGTMAR